MSRVLDTTAPAPVQRVLDRLEHVRRNGDGWQARCPAHSDRNPSLSISTGEDGRALLHCHAGCSTDEVVAALELRLGDLFPDDQDGTHGSHATTPTAEYDYVDEGGELLFQVVRQLGKQFRQRQPDGHGGWEWSLNGTRRVLYRLPAVAEAVEQGRFVFVVEGEKDVHSLERLGITATTNPGGAGKWRPEYSSTLRGARVVVCGDRDEPGEKHVQAVAESLRGIAQEVRVLDLDPAGGEGYDLSDFLADARTPEEVADAKRVLREAVKTAPVFPSTIVSTTRASTVVQTNSGLPFALLGDALADTPLEPDWLWEGFLAPGAVTFLAGRPKVGKLTLLFALFAALSTGEAFLDRKARPSPVVLLTEERQGTLIEKESRFKVGAQVHVLMRHQTGGLAWPEVVAEAAAYCEQRRIPVLVIDGWDKWAGLLGDSENAAGRVLEAVAPLQEAASKGLCVAIVGHQRKAAGAFGEAIRGSNALAGAVDVIVELERAGADLPPAVRVLRSLSRYEQTPEELTFELQGNTYKTCGDLNTVKLHAKQDRIVAALEQLTEGTVEEVAEEAGQTPSTTRRRLAELAEAGLVESSGGGARNDPRQWRLIDLHHHQLQGGGNK